MSSDAHLHRAARSGRRLLRRALPAAFLPWLESLAPQSDSPEEVWATAGALGAIGLALEKAYLESGVEVRELIWALHRLLREGEEARGRVKGLESWEPWLLERLAAGDAGREPGEKGNPVRSMLFQWVEVANERLTMQGYHRRDQRVRHARVLIAAPLEVAGAIVADKLADFAELLLRFYDHLDAKSQADLGRNRIEEPTDESLGGLYSMGAGPAPPSEKAIEVSLGQLNDDLGAFQAGDLPATLQTLAQRASREMRHAIEERLRRGAWPSQYRLATAEQRRAPPPWWRRPWIKRA